MRARLRRSASVGSRDSANGACHGVLLCESREPLFGPPPRQSARDGGRSWSGSQLPVLRRRPAPPTDLPQATAPLPCLYPVSCICLSARRDTPLNTHPPSRFLSQRPSNERRGCAFSCIFRYSLSHFYGGLGGQSAPPPFFSSSHLANRSSVALVPNSHFARERIASHFEDYLSTFSPHLGPP